MKLYDYTNLLKAIREIDLETDTLKNLKEMSLHNKLLELENKLLNSGILEDWMELNKIYKTFYSRWQNTYLNNVYESREAFMEYGEGVFQISMSSGSCHSDDLYISPKRSVEQNKVVWDIKHTTSRHYFDGFENYRKEYEYETKILVIETLIATYENYRSYVLKKVMENMKDKINHNEKLQKEIMQLI